MSNSLDPDQARQIYGPHLGPNCLQVFSADDTIASRQRVNLPHAEYFYLSHGVASGSEITPCIKIDKQLVVYRFSGNVMK